MNFGTIRKALSDGPDYMEGRMYRDGKWARQLIALQHDDGSWGRFHSMATRGDSPVTTEQALRRLRILGYTIEDECIRRAVDYMDGCLCGRNEIPDPREKLHNWDLFTALMLSARIREFTLDNPNANRVAGQWAKVVSHALSGGSYSHERYAEAYAGVFGLKPRGGRLVDFTGFYQISLLQDQLDENEQYALMDYLLPKQDGMYYIYDRPLNRPPEFSSRRAVAYLGAMEILAGYRYGRRKLEFVAGWLEENRNENGGWDMGAQAKDGVYFPLSDDWRRKSVREADCTYRINALLSRLKQKG